eukprot:358418-Chlamydomonas_euryale.AAC.2
MPKPFPFFVDAMLMPLLPSDLSSHPPPLHARTHARTHPPSSLSATHHVCVQPHLLLYCPRGGSCGVRRQGVDRTTERLASLGCGLDGLCVACSPVARSAYGLLVASSLDTFLVASSSVASSLAGLRVTSGRPRRPVRGCRCRAWQGADAPAAATADPNYLPGVNLSRAFGPCGP